MVIIEQMEFGYTRKKPVYQNFSLRLETGRVYGLLGVNGVGKSTLLHLISGLLRPCKGEVSFKDYTCSDRKVDMLSDLFLLPEEFQLPNIRIPDFLDLYAPFYPRFDRDLFFHWLREFEVDTALSISELSMGNRKKFYLSFAVASGCSLLLMDEPTNGLDIPGKGVFRRLMASALTEERTCVISTHQGNEVEKMLDEVIILDQKGVQLQASVEWICKKLLFTEIAADEHPSGVLYSEPSLNGNRAVLLNANGKESVFSVELLFNAVHRAGERVREALL